MRSALPSPPAHVIRRYENRKLYDVQARRYVTLEGLARLVGGGADLRVVDQRTDEDITSVVLAQVVLEGIKERTASIPQQVLTRLIRLGSGRAGAFAEWLDPQEASARVRGEAERIVSGLVARGRLTLDEALALRQDITGSVQRLVAEAQSSLHARLRGVLARGKGDGVRPALQALGRKLSTFEEILVAPPAPARRRSRRGRRRAPRGQTRS